MVTLQKRHRSSWKMHLLTVGAALPFLTVVIGYFMLFPFVKAQVLRLLSQNNIRLRAHPRIHAALSSIAVSGIEFDVQDDMKEPNFASWVHIERVEYRFLPPFTQAGSFGHRDLVTFGQIQLSNVTVIVHDPHPQPRLEVLDIKLTLSAAPLPHTLAMARNQLLSIFNYSGDQPIGSPLRSFLHIDIHRLGITTHTVTSIPIPLEHPILRRIADIFPFLFDQGENKTPQQVMIYSPHLSLLTPSLIFPATYQALSSFRQHLSTQNPHVHHYRFPLSSSLQTRYLDFTLTPNGRSRIEEASVQLTLDDQDDQHMMDLGHACTNITIMNVKAMELSGRDADEGGCCSLYVGFVSNYQGRVGIPVIERIKEVRSSLG